MPEARARTRDAANGTPLSDGRRGDGPPHKPPSPVRGTSPFVGYIIATLRRMQPLAVEVFYRAVNLVAALFFWLATCVQINDDDSVFWMVLYAVPATVATLLLVKPSPQGSTWLVTLDLGLTLGVLVYTTWLPAAKQHDTEHPGPVGSL